MEAGPTSPVLILAHEIVAPLECLSENSRQGVSAENHPSHRGCEVEKSPKALEKSSAVRRDRGGACCSGRENDATGLYFYRARYYSPTYQRFIAQDPIGFASGDANLYAYVSDDPVDWADSLGKAVFPPRPGDIFATPGISCSKLGGWLLGGAGMISGGLIGSLFPPAASAGSVIVEPLLGGIAGSMGGMTFGDQVFGNSGWCTPNPPPQACQ